MSLAQYVEADSGSHDDQEDYNMPFRLNVTSDCTSVVVIKTRPEIQIADPSEFSNKKTLNARLRSEYFAV